MRPVQRLQVGDISPEFTLPATGGREVSLNDYRREQHVVLVFFPAAFTPV